MSTEPSTPPAGWYPSPDGGELRWWDGVQWTTHHQSAVSAQPSGRSSALPRLAQATQVLLVGSILLAVLTIGVEVFGVTAINAYNGGSRAAIDLITAYDQISLVISVLTVLVLLATAVLWVLWQYRAAKRVAGRTRRTPGWHVGSWFIPVVNLWFPYQNVADLWRATGRTPPPWQVAWWVLWLVSNMVVSISSRLYLSAQTLDEYLIAIWVGIVGYALTAVAGVLAWLIVRGVTEALQRDAARLATSPQ